MRYVLALDQGTTSSRALLYDREGIIRGLAQRELQQIYPRASWVEHDPEEIWASQMGVAVEALSRAHARPRDVAALGITNQRETTIIWERKTGNPVHNAIVWQDRRTAPICKQLSERGLEKTVREKTGLLIDAYFSATKIMWILENVNGAREKANAGELAFGTVDSWLIWNLTSGKLHTIDASNASRTMLFNIHEGTWDRELLDALDIPDSILPEVRSSSGSDVPVSTSLALAGVPIGGVAGDQQAALFGQACFGPGMAKCTYGTGAFLLQTLGTEPKPSKSRLLTTIAWQRDNKLEYAMEGSVFAAGSVVQWLRDGLGIIRTADEVEALASTVADNGGVYIVPAFTGLGAPHWDPLARGAIVGITRGTKTGHIARAALESIAFPGDGSVERDARGFRHLAGNPASGWRSRAQRYAAAVSGGSARHPGGSLCRRGIDLARSGISGRSRRWLLAGSGRASGALESGEGVPAGESTARNGKAVSPMAPSGRAV